MDLLKKTNFQHSRKKTINRFFFVVYVNKETSDNVTFMDACRKLTNLIVRVSFSRVNIIGKYKYLCKGMLNPEYIIQQLHHADFLVCVLNQVDGTLAGYTFGNLYINDTYSRQISLRYSMPLRWAAFYIKVLCGHSLFKGPGPVLMNFLKCLTYYISLLEPTKNGFMLDSIDTKDTIAFYQSNGVIPFIDQPILPDVDMNESLDINPNLFRFWVLPPYKKMKPILKQFKKYDIKFKVNPREREGLELEEPNTPPPVPSLQEIHKLVSHSDLKKSPTGWSSYIPEQFLKPFVPLFSSKRRAHKSPTPLSVSVSPILHSPSLSSYGTPEPSPVERRTKKRYSLRSRSKSRSRSAKRIRTF